MKTTQALSHRHVWLDRPRIPTFPTFFFTSQRCPRRIQYLSVSVAWSLVALFPRRSRWIKMGSFYGIKMGSKWMKMGSKCPKWCCQCSLVECGASPQQRLGYLMIQGDTPEPGETWCFPQVIGIGSGGTMRLAHLAHLAHPALLSTGIGAK